MKSYSKQLVLSLGAVMHLATACAESPMGLSQMEPMTNEEAIPILEAEARAGSSDAFRAIAGRAGIGSYYFLRMKTLTDADTAEADAEVISLFRYLANVPSEQTLMAVAEIMNAASRRNRDAANPDEITPDKAAAQVLGFSNLPDAPVTKSPIEYTAEDYSAWRDWLAALAFE